MHRLAPALRSPLASPLASVVALVALLVLAPGCKGMGGVMSGLGKVAAGAASGVAHVVPAVARGVAHAAPAITHGVAHAGGAVARGVARTTPTVLRASESAIETAIDVASSLPDVEVDTGPWIAPGVEIDETAEAPRPPGATDPCQACPVDVECGVCAGYAGYACIASPAGAPARCESSAPADAPPAPLPPGASPGWFRF